MKTRIVAIARNVFPGYTIITTASQEEPRWPGDAPMPNVQHVILKDDDANPIPILKNDWRDHTSF